MTLRFLARFSCALITAAASTHTAAGAESFDCLIEPTQTVAVRSPVTGVLDQVHVKRGDKIRKGQVIATLESSAERAASDLATFKATMSAPLEVSRTKVEYTRRTYERRRDMHSQNLMSGQEKDEAESELRSAEAELRLAEENRELAKLEAREKASLLHRRTIRSPFDGVVADQQVYPGEVVEPSSNDSPILKLAQLDPLRVHVILPRSLFGTIKVGDRAEVRPELSSIRPLSGTVKIVDSLIDAASGTFAVFLEMPNPQLEVPAGLRCSASFSDSQSR